MVEKKKLNTDIGARIQSAREKANLTQEQLAEKINRSTQFISILERGIAGPSIETVILLCETLHVSADYLLLGLEKSPASVSRRLSLFSPEQLAIVDAINERLLQLAKTD